MFINTSEPFAARGRHTSGNASSKQMGVEMRTYGISFSSVARGSSASEMTFTAGFLYAGEYRPGTSKNTYWSPGVHPAEMPIVFFRNADTAGISEKGRTSAHGTRWFFPYAPRIIPSLSNSIAAFMTFLGE